MKKLLLLLFLTLSPMLFAQTSTTETFETEREGFSSFTDNGVIFDIVSHSSTFNIRTNYPGSGWNGTTKDNQYIYNTNNAGSTNPSFSIKATSTLFKVNRFWVYVEDKLGNQNVVGPLTITGKLNGITIFTQTKSTGFVTSKGTNNGFTLIDMTNLNSQNFSNIVIDELQLTLGGNYYLGLDAFTWVKDTGGTPPDSKPFITTWDVTTGSIKINTDTNNYTYNYSVNWENIEDPTKKGNLFNQKGDCEISNLPKGKYKVSISGTFPYFKAAKTFDDSNAKQLLTVEQWGTQLWKSMRETFQSASNLSQVGKDVPNLNQVTDMSRMFDFATSFNGDLSKWDVSKVTDMQYIFSGASSFNGDLSKWNVSSLKNMQSMFHAAVAFNGDLSKWNVSSATNMIQVFALASQFNSDLSKWNVSNVTDMQSMFLGASSFDSDLSKWNVSKVIGPYGMVSMLDNSGMSINNYDATLKGWASLSTIKSNITLGATGLKYCTASAERNKLIKEKGWKIIGDVEGCPSIPLTAKISGTNVSCNGGSNGTASVNVSGGTGGYIYSWSPSGGTAATATGLTAGTYTVTIEDGNGGQIMKTFTITEPDLLTARVLQTNVSCKGGTNGTATVIPSGGTGGYTYSWSPSGGRTTTAAGLTAGTYTVTVTDAKSCTTTQSVTITEPAEALTAITAQTNVSCNGGSNGSATVIASGGTGNYTYSWSPSGGTAATATGLSKGTYTVTITDANACMAKLSFTITEPAEALTATISGTNVSCNGGTNGTATVVASGGAAPYSYLWNNGATTRSITGLTAGTYEVTVTDANLCQITKTFNITQPTAITATIKQTDVSCKGGTNGTATVIPSGGTGSYTYSWAPSGGTAATATGLTAGSYTVTITDGNACTITRSFTITQPSALTATMSQTNVSCNGGSNGSATVTPSGGTGNYTYLWLPSGGTAARATGLTAGDYTVTVTDANGCTTTQSVTITQPKALTTIGLVTNVSCNGGTNGSATVIVSGGTGGYTYSWAPSGGTAAKATGLTAGSYIVTVTDANGCTATQSITIIDGDVVTKPITETSLSYKYGDAPHSLSATSLNGNKLNWYTEENGTLSKVSLIAPTPSTSKVGQQFYYVSQVNQFGCESPLEKITVTIGTAKLTVTATTKSKIYGAVDPKLDYIVSGLVNNDKEIDVLSGSLSRDAGENVGSYTITQSDLKANSNYTLDFKTANLSIGTAPLTVTATTKSKIYGAVDPKLDYIVSGLVNNDKEIDVLSGSLSRDAGENVGSYAITQGDLKANSNYTLDFKTANLTIGTAPLTVTANPQSKIYGAVDPKLDYTVSGLVNNDKETAVLLGSLSRAIGEDVGNYTITQGDLKANGNYTLDYKTANLTIGKAPLIVTATTQSKVYGAVDPKLDYTVSGLVNNDKETAVLSGSLSRAIGEDVGNYTITQGDLKANGNYTLDYKTANLTIGKAPLIVTATTQSKVYGAVDPKLDYIVSGLVNNDKETAVLTGGLSRATGEDVGNYTITQGDLKANSNYALDFKTTNLTIGTAPLTVTANPQSKVYGAIDPKLDYVVSGVVNNDKETAVLSGSLSRAIGENVGSYAITQDDLKANSNYTLDFKTANLSIGTAPLTVTATTKSKIYGAVDPKLAYTVSGLQFTDKDTDVLTGGLSRAKGENVGSYAITQGDLKANSNYILDFKTANLSIGTAPLTVTATTKSKIYGAVDPKLAYTVSGLQFTDKDTDVLTGSLSRDAGENVGSYTITQSDLKANGNYTLDFKTANLSIGTAPLTVTATTKSKIYGAVDPKLAYTVSGLQFTDKDTDVLTGSLSRAIGEDVGSYTITQGDLKANGNYTLDYKTANLTISTAPLTLTANPKSKIYGAVDPKLDYTVSGLVNNDKETAVLSGSLSRAKGEDVGVYAINKNDLKANSNYALDFKTANLTIGKAPLTVTANVKTKVYGSVDPKLDYTVSGLQLTDKETAVLTGGLSRDAGENVGSYTITQSDLKANGNYTLEFTGADLSITPAKLSVTTNTQSKVYGDSDPKLAYTVSGLQFTDKDTDVLSGSLSRIKGENVASYVIDKGTLKTNDNYTLDFTGASMSITPAKLSVTATVKSKVYGAVDPKLDYTVSGLVNNDKETAVLSGGLSRDKGENVGSYAITQGDLKANNNYTLDFKTANLTIGKAPLIVTATTQSKVYGAVDPKLDYIVSGLVNNDKETAVLSGSLSRDAGENVGSYTITQGDLKANSNYTVDFKTANLSIGTAKLTVTATTKSKIYGAVDPKLVYTVSGLVNNDKEIAVLTGGLSRTIGEDVGTYVINQNDLKANSNYTLDFKTANLIITSAKLTVTASVKTKVYGAVDPKLDYTVSGLVNNDKETAVLTGSLSRAKGENVGVYAINQNDLKANGNYTLDFKTASLSIGTAPLTVIANPKSKVYGAVDPELDYIVSGLQFTDKDTDVLSGSLSRTIGENVGSYIITQGALIVNNNYVLDFKTANLTITSAKLTVTVNPKSKIYGAVDPKLDYVVSGLVNNDKETAVLSGSLSRAKGENVGVYVINQGALIENSNYTLDFKTANLIITSAKLTVTASVKTKVYGAVDPKLDYTVSGLVNNDKETAVLTGSLSRAKGENVGVYAINQNDLKANGNYTLDFKTANLIITSAKLTVTASVKTKVYGAVDPKLDYTVSGLVNNDKETAVLSGSLSRAKGEDVGVYAINQNDLKANSNYTLDFKTANLTITSAKLTVTANPQSKVYGAVDPKFDYVVSGLVNNDKETAVLSGGLFRAKGENVGTYVIIQNDLKTNGNYSLSYVSNNLVITPATISGLSLTDAIYTYDGTERTLMLKGNLPSDMQVSYTANKQTEAGVYQITALVTGANYKDLTLMAKLTITKAKQHIEFDKLSPVIYNTNLQLQLSAVSSSGLPITYSSGDEVGVAIVDPLGLVKILKPGSIVITAQQAGNNNYEPAQSVSQVLLVQNDEADIEGLSINGSDMGKMSSNEYFIIDCEDIDSQVSIALKTSAGANVSTGNNFVIRTPKAGIYRQEIIVKSQSEKASKKYVIEIERPFVFDEIVTQKFNNTLIANNNPLTNGGYKFTGYRWFRNGQLIGTGQIYSVGNNKEDLLDRDALYSVELTTDKGEVLHSCSSTISYSNTNSIKLYPNPIVKQGELEIAIDYPDSSLKGVTASIYSVTGQFLFKTVLQDRISKVVLPYTLVEGSYIMIIKIDGKNKTFRFIVKPN